MAKHNFQFNVPEVPQASILGLPTQGVAAYRGSPDQAIDFCEALRTRLGEYNWGEVVFDNIDVAQVQWSDINFSLFMDVLQEKGVSTKRLKAFKCGLDDEAIKLVAGWLEMLNADAMPSEIHLSHNKITAEGFDALVAVLEMKRAELAQAAAPVWVRVENNGVPEEHLKDLEAQGKVVKVAGIWDRKPSETAVVAMPSFAATGGASGAQKWSPVPQAGGLQWGAKGGKGGGLAVAAWNANGKGAAASWQGGSSWTPQRPAGAAQALQAYGAVGKGAAFRPLQYGGGKGAPAAIPAARITPAAVRPLAARQVQQIQPLRPGQAGVAARAATAADRSRTPITRKPEPAEPKLAPGWSKEWSDEYQIPYFWNKETGDSVWEPPEA